MQIESVLQTKNRSEPAKNRFSVALFHGLVILPNIKIIWWINIIVGIRATENWFFAGSDRFLVCKTDLICIKHIFFGPKKHSLRIIY